MAVDYNELLYKKLAKENKDFTDNLKTKPPEQIIEASYEKIIKDDLLSIFECTDFSQLEAKALYMLKNPLDALYQEWLHNDLSFYDTGVSAKYGDKLLTLSTCEYTHDNGRLVVVAKRRD